MAEEKLSGWLFFNIHHRDPLSDRVLEIPPARTNTRPWFYLIAVDGEPCRLVHAVEAGILDHLPGTKKIYGSYEQLVAHLRSLASEQRLTAAQYSSENLITSFLDHGTARLLEDCGFSLCPSLVLMQRFLGLLDPKQIVSHERAANELYRIVKQTWKRVGAELSRGMPLREAEVRAWILEMFEEADLCTDSPPLVACAGNSADPHYMISGQGSLLKVDAVLQLDLWAREKGRSGAAGSSNSEDAAGGANTNGVYANGANANSAFADISWVGVLGRPDAEQEQAFQVIRDARGLAVGFIAESFAKGNQPRGRDVDSVVRSFLIESGYGGYLKHRTGHAIDTDVHGFGVNLDSIEFPDSRCLLEGSCFSIEPGVYLPHFGMRTEIDVYIRDGKPIISGGEPQEKLLCWQGS